MGFVEIVLGLIQAGRIIELVGAPVVIGYAWACVQCGLCVVGVECSSTVRDADFMCLFDRFVNGLAIVIGASQVSNFERFTNETET
jgi:hypothetical protein